MSSRGGKEGGKGAVAPVKKSIGGGLSPPKIICSCDGEPSSIASIILMEQTQYS